MAGLFTVHNFVVLIVIIAYALIVWKYSFKSYFIWAASFLMIILGVLSVKDAFMAIDWNILGIYLGMMLIAEMFLYSKAPDVLAEKIVNRSHKGWIALLGVCLLSGIMSAVLANVAVVLIIAPIALWIAKDLKMSPAPILIGVAVMSNLQGVATMVGDPPSLLLASYAGMNFNDFFFFHGRPALFFAVQIGAVASLAVLYFIFRKFQNPVTDVKCSRIKSYFPAFLILLMISLLAITSFVTYAGSSSVISFLNDYKVGLISVSLGLVAWLWYFCRERKDAVPMLKRLDWDTGLFLVGIFISVAALIKICLMQEIASFLASIAGSSVFLAFVIIIITSMAISAFVDNVPLVTAMLPVSQSLSETMGVSPYLFYFALLIGASVGGNITPVGASANVVAMGILKHNKAEPSFWEFVKIGLPFTLVATLFSTAFVWIVFS